MLMHENDRGFATEPTARACKNVTRKAVEIDDNIGREKDIDDVSGILGRLTGSDGNNVFATPDQTFAQQETGSEFRIVARSAHRDGHTSAFDPYLQGLFFCNPIFFGNEA